MLVDRLTNPRALLSKRVIVTSCVDASLLTSLRCSNAALAILEDLIASHLRAPESLPFPTRLHFGFLLVDEAAQASEMELCVPLAVVAPAPPFTALLPLAKPTLTLPHVTICGDVKQLGPRIESAECRSHDMDVSLLERLFERDVYKQSPFTRTAIHAQRRWLGYPPAKKQPLSTPFCNLTKSYRSHPAILMVPSTLVRSRYIHFKHWCDHSTDVRPSSTRTHSSHSPPCRSRIPL